MTAKQLFSKTTPFIIAKLMLGGATVLISGTAEIPAGRFPISPIPSGICGHRFWLDNMRKPIPIAWPLPLPKKDTAVRRKYRTRWEI